MPAINGNPVMNNNNLGPPNFPNARSSSSAMGPPTMQMQSMNLGPPKPIMGSNGGVGNGAPGQPLGPPSPSLQAFQNGPKMSSSQNYQPPRPPANQSAPMQSIAGQTGMPMPPNIQSTMPQQSMGQSGLPPSNNQPGLPPTGLPQPMGGQPNLPPTSQPGFPQNSQEGQLAVGQGGLPPTSQPMAQPSVTQSLLGQSGLPPSTSQSGLPPISQPRLPPVGQPGVAPVGQPAMPRPGVSQSNATRPGFPQAPMNQSGQARHAHNQPGMIPMSQSTMRQPGLSQPPLGQPGMPQPPMSQPGLMPQPTMGQPGMPQPTMAQPGMPQPPMGQPGMPQPTMGQPGMPQPPMGQPGLPQQRMGQPGAPQPSRPGIGQPGMARPGLAQPGMPQPPMGQPGMPQPPMGQPGMPQPPMGQPGMPQPPMGQPGMPQPPMGQPGMPRPQIGQPGMPQPPMGQPSMAGPGYPGAQQGMSGGRRGLDPDQMPSPIQVMEEDEINRSGFFDTSEKGLMPPLVTTKFTTRDMGNASPRLIRSTMYTVPNTSDMLKQTGVPFGLVISPFAKTVEGETEPPLSDFGSSGPVRCIRCKAYMGPFMQFIDGGRRFQCPFCKATTDVPEEYFQHLDHNGLRLDHYQRPELCLGAYELVATKDYCRDSVEPQIPAILFAIDVSYPMMKEGVVHLLCQNMRTLLKHLPKDPHRPDSRVRVGFITYDSKVHFYNVRKELSQPQQMIVGDVNDMFVPLVEGFIVDPQESEAVLNALLDEIPTMFKDTKETETILGPVVQAGKEAFKAAGCVGKLIVFHHNLPSIEAPGKLRNRDDRKLLGTDKEKSVLMPQTKFYNELGQDCVAAGCSVDLFLFNNAYIDIATLSQVSRLTGGQVYKYTYFHAPSDGERFLRDLEHNLSRPIVFDAIMRVRTSTGVRPVDFYGAFFMANTTDTELASMNADASVACEVKHDDKLTEEDGVYIQVAVLFTSCGGQRRLRILNLSLNTTSKMADMYRACELDTLINFTAKQSMSRLMESNPKSVKESLINNCAHSLAAYRKHCASPSSTGQLILPECMKLLPLYTNCLIKSDVLAGGADVGCDDRAYLMSALSSMDVLSTSGLFYPRLYALHDLSPSESGLPSHALRASSEKVSDQGVYVLDNGFFLFIYIGLAADPAFLEDVFGVSTASSVSPDLWSLERRDNPMSDRVRNVIEILRQGRQRFMKIVIVRQKDKLDILFRHHLCEDRTGHDGNFSYVDFLCHMHKEIRALLG